MAVENVLGRVFHVSHWTGNVSFDVLVCAHDHHACLQIWIDLGSKRCIRKHQETEISYWNGSNFDGNVMIFLGFMKCLIGECKCFNSGLVHGRLQIAESAAEIRSHVR